MNGNFMKKTGIVFLFFISLMAALMTWQMNILSNFGGICIIGFCFGAAMLMWLDVLDVNGAIQRSVKKDDKRTKAEH